MQPAFSRLLSFSKGRMPEKPVDVDANTDEILAELGFTDAEIKILRDSGVAQ